MSLIGPADLATFLAIARHRSFRNAAIELGVSASALSHALRGIEERLDVRLVNRTTRSVALTEAGERLFVRVSPAFQDIDDALEDLNHFRGKPAGTLRFNAARQSAQLVLLPIVTRFLKAYPEINVEIAVNDGLVDMVSAGFDAHVRDPLAQLRLAEDDFVWITEKLLDVAAKHTGGKLVATLEGGYDLEALASSTAAHVATLMGAS